MTPEDLVHYKCTQCDGHFYVPRDKESDTDWCPYCSDTALFNVTFEEELGNC